MQQLGHLELPHPGHILGGLLDLVELKDEIHHSVSTLRDKIASFTTPHEKIRKLRHSNDLQLHDRLSCSNT